MYLIFTIRNLDTKLIVLSPFESIGNDLLQVIVRYFAQFISGQPDLLLSVDEYTNTPDGIDSRRHFTTGHDQRGSRPDDIPSLQSNFGNGKFQ